MTTRYLITGASSGIGLGFLKSLSNTDAQITAIVRNVDKLRESIADCTYKNLEILSVDLSDSAAITTSLQSIDKEALQFDCFLHCAGIQSTLTVKKATNAKCLDVMQVNFLSFVEIMRLLIKSKCKENTMKVIALSSMGAYSPIPGNELYAASKAALDAYIRCAAKELFADKVYINTIAPSWVDTPMANRSMLAISHEDFNGFLKSGPQPAGLIPISEMVKRIGALFENTNAYMTGETVQVNGGA